MTLEQVEEKAILDAIIEVEYHLSNEATKLDIARKTLSNKCQKYGVLRANGRGINPAAVKREREKF